MRNAKLSDMKNKFRKVYYGRAMDGMKEKEMASEYNMIDMRLKENAMELVNPFTRQHKSYIQDKHNGKLVAQDNWKKMNEADCVIINLSIRVHLYIGCIDEMVNANQKGCFVIVIVGEAGADKHYYTHMRADLIVKTIDEAFAFFSSRFVS